jgi:hypothetical protein
LKTSENSIIIYADRESEVSAMFNIGGKLKKYRKRKNMSQQEFAQFLGISQNYLSEIENDIYTPSLKKIAQFAVKLNISVQKLLSEKPE